MLPVAALCKHYQEPSMQSTLTHLSPGFLVIVDRCESGGAFWSASTTTGRPVTTNSHLLSIELPVPAARNVPVPRAPRAHAVRILPEYPESFPEIRWE